MTLAIIHSRTVYGIQAHLVTIEVHITPGMPGLGMVGLPETAVKESRHRVRCAILNSNFDYPQRRITVNLGPADLPKNSSGLDLPIALGILAASGQLRCSHIECYEYVGELALSGILKPIKGILPLAMATASVNRALILPCINAKEAALIKSLTVYAASDLQAVTNHINNQTQLVRFSTQFQQNKQIYACISDIKGQSYAKRALEIAAAGGHHLLMCGPPGSGKTMLASRLPGILPKMPEQHALESASIYSISQQGFQSQYWKKHPFRSPHHTVSQVAMVGGGKVPRPGEVSLAHRGVLFLDEFPQFQRNVLEVLREPLESGEVHISRASGQACFPAAFQLIAAMNPCPCGYYGDLKKNCRCTEDQIQRYRAKISGPLLDRIDLQLLIERVPTKILLQQNTHEIQTSDEIRKRVVQAHQQQWMRYQKSNALLDAKEVMRYCFLQPSDQVLLERAIDQFNLSVRSVHRILKVARTIADLALVADIKTIHLTEALSYRFTDKIPDT